VTGFGTHVDAALYKRGLDNTDRLYWNNYQYGTLAIAPTDALTLRLWQIGDEVSKGAHDAQYDTKARRSRGGAFIGRFAAGKDSKGNGIWRFSNGARTEFRSSEGGAYRLEGGQWWWITWDEWASQPDREIHKIRNDVLLGRARDHDAKIMPMAWPKPKTEHHLIASSATSNRGATDSQVVYLDATKALGPTRTRSRSSSATKSPPRSCGRSRAVPPAARRSSSSRRSSTTSSTRTCRGRSSRGGLRLLLELGPRHRQRRDGRLHVPHPDRRRQAARQPAVQGPDRQPDELPGSDTRDLDDITMARPRRAALYRSQAPSTRPAWAGSWPSASCAT
jgi:hypothetical protein